MATRWTSKHTGKKIDDTIDYVCNPNLLDNWYFGNPVNQRGQTSWTNPSNMQYAIDRWQITPSSVVALVDGGITVTAEIQQGLEKSRLELGRTYTFSVLSSDRRLGKHTFVIASDMTTISVNFGFGIFVCYLSGDNVWLQIYGDGSTYKAAKLELGNQQTLAHQDENGNWVLNEIPDYGEQLARCQRYCRVYKAGTTLPYLAYPQMDGGWYASAGLPTNGMRVIPTNNLGDGKEVAIVDLDGADATHDDMSMSNWGQNGNMLCLRISGGSHGVLTSKFPYHVKLKADLILSADL